MAFSSDKTTLCASTFEAWKASLLDLTSENPLYRLPVEAVVALSAPNEVYEPLVRKKRPLQYWDMRSPLLSRDSLKEIGNFLLPPPALDTMRHLFLEATAVRQGQDINLLYIAFGTLTWTPKRELLPIKTPLLLVPVHIERMSEGRGYLLTRQGEEVELNPLLLHCLCLREIGIELPKPPEESYLVPSAYLRTLKDFLVGKELGAGWTVGEETVLGRFPLVKMRLYDDLTKLSTRALQHPVVRALAGDTAALTTLPTVSLPTVSELNVAPERDYLLLSADTAQEQAIVAASRGYSFVLEGPPGTGKTQTIINILGQLLSQNKSVLLVSNRIASLEAIHQRLQERGLGHLCLRAHSLKTSHRDILAQIEETLSLPRKSNATQSRSNATQEISLEKGKKGEKAALRERAKERESYLDALLHEQLPSGLSLYQVLGCITLLQYQETPDLNFSWEVDLGKITLENIQSWQGILASLGKHPDWPRIVRMSFWLGIVREGMTKGEVNALAEALQAFQEKIRHLEATSRDLAALSMLQQAKNEQEIAEQSDIISTLMTLPPLQKPKKDALSAEYEKLLAMFELFQEQFKTQKEVWLSLSKSQNAHSARRLQQWARSGKYRNFLPNASSILSDLYGKDWQLQSLKARLVLKNEDAFKRTKRAYEEKVQCLEHLQQLLPSLNLTELINLIESGQVAHLIELTKSPASWQSEDGLLNAQNALREAQSLWEDIRRNRDPLHSIYQEAFWKLDHQALLTPLRKRQSGLVRLLSIVASPDGKHAGKHVGKDAGKLVQATLQEGVRRSETEILRDLETAVVVQEKRHRINEQEPKFQMLLGEAYHGQDTNWDSLSIALTDYERSWQAVPQETRDSLMDLICKGTNNSANNDKNIENTLAQYARLTQTLAVYTQQIQESLSTTHFIDNTIDNTIDIRHLVALEDFWESIAAGHDLDAKGHDFNAADISPSQQLASLQNRALQVERTLFQERIRYTPFLTILQKVYSGSSEESLALLDVLGQLWQFAP